MGRTARGRGAARGVTIRAVPLKPEGVILVCGKCGKRNGGKDRLSKPLKRALKPRRLKVVKTRCLGVCPGRATALHDSRRPREWLIVRNDTSLDEVVASLVSGVG